MREIVADFGEIGQVMVELLVKGLAGDKNEQVYSPGMTHILNQPEFRDVESQGLNRGARTQDLG